MFAILLLCTGATTGRAQIVLAADSALTASDTTLWAQIPFLTSIDHFRAALPDSVQKIGCYNYTVAPMATKEGMAKALSINGTRCSYPQFEKVAFEEMINLYDVFRGRYGLPLYEDQVPSEWMDMEIEAMSIYAAWEHGPKRVIIGIFRNETTGFYAKAFIYSRRVMDGVSAR